MLSTQSLPTMIKSQCTGNRGPFCCFAFVFTTSSTDTINLISYFSKKNMKFIVSVSFENPCKFYTIDAERERERERERECVRVCVCLHHQKDYSGFVTLMESLIGSLLQ